MGRTSKSAPRIHAAAEISELTKCARVDEEVTSATPLTISAGKRPWPATARPEITKSAVAAVLKTDGVRSTSRAMIAPTNASSTPNSPNPIRFHRTEYCVPAAPSSLIVLTAWE